MKHTNGFLLILCTLLLVSWFAAPGTARGDDTIFDIQLGLYNEGDIVTVEDVIVTATGLQGFFIQEPDPDVEWGYKYSGIWVYAAQTHLGVLSRGDLVNVTGAYEEYYDLSEINISGGSFTLLSSGNTLMDPVDVLISEVNNTGADSEAYEGVLVKVDREDTSLFARALNEFDDWYLATDPTIGVGDSLTMLQHSADPEGDFIYGVPDAGTELAFSIGILTYTYDEYKLAPRNCNDNGDICKPELMGAYATGSTTLGVQFSSDVEESSANDSDNYELISGLLITGAQRDATNHKRVNLTTQAQPNGVSETIIISGVKAESGGLEMDPNQTADFYSGITSIYDVQHVDDPGIDDASPLVNQVVTLQGTVTATAGSRFYLQDGDGGGWDNLYIYISSPAVQVGDIIQIAGEVTEYYGLTELSFRGGVNHFVNFGQSRAEPVVIPVTAADIPYSSWLYGLNEVESLESALVHLGPALLDSSLVSDDAMYGDWYLSQEPDTAATSLGYINYIYYEPCLGDEIEMTGILAYTYNAYRIAPRTDDDITIISGCNIASVDEFSGKNLWLSPARPNPFGQISTVRFGLPEKGEVDLFVYGASGRLVRTLFSGSKEAGSHTVQWDGRNDAGHKTPAGLYFIQLQTPQGDRSSKVLIVR